MSPFDEFIDLDASDWVYLLCHTYQRKRCADSGYAIERVCTYFCDVSIKEKHAPTQGGGAESAAPAAQWVHLFGGYVRQKRHPIVLSSTLSGYMFVVVTFDKQHTPTRWLQYQ